MPNSQRAEMSPFRIPTPGWHMACVGLLLAGVLAILVHAHFRRASQEARQPEVQSVVRLLGVADLALSSSSRWLRHPSITEPGAPFADGPAILDNDPAGAAIGPPLSSPSSGIVRRFQTPNIRGQE